jgi:polysaccharide export outer membrane protein
MTKKIYCIFLLFSLFAVTGCIHQKEVIYFQKKPNQSDTISIAQAYIPKIQPGDILAIHIGSLNAAASSFFNPYSAQPLSSEITDAGGQLAAATSQPNSGLLVNASGEIELPLIGGIKVGGLTTTEAANAIKNEAKKLLKGTTVTVRFMNYKISIVGEVAKPSVYVIPNEKITLPEALSLAGDLTIYGRRNNVLIIRDVDGKKEFGRVDLSSRELYTSPYYYLHNNDVIYVEPTGSRIAQSDKIYQLLPVILSGLSFIIIILQTTIKR